MNNQPYAPIREKSTEIAGPVHRFSGRAAHALPVVPFLVALTLSLACNWSSSTHKAFLVFDSSHYLQSTELFFRALCGDRTHLQALATSLNLDGPVLPAAGAIASLMFSTPPDTKNVQALIILQCLLHAMSASLVFVLAKRLYQLGTMIKSRRDLAIKPAFTKNSPAPGIAQAAPMYWTALATSLIFAASPAAIIGCGRYLTETITTTLLLTLVSLLSTYLQQVARAGDEETTNLPVPARLWQLKRSATLVLCGMCTALVILSKSALLPAAAAITLGSIAWRAGVRSICRRLMLLATGAAIIVAPWGFFTWMATGHLQLLPDRLPGWNIALGSDVETDGWSAIPVPPLLDQNYFDKPLNIVFGIYSQHPVQYVDLTLRKILRLFGASWNDFAVTTPLGQPVVAMLHQFTLLTAICAIFLLLAVLSGNNAVNRKSDRTMLQLGCICAAVLAGHLVFVPFEAIPRYAYSATPFALLLASLFLAQLDKHSLKRWLPCAIGGVLLMQVDLVPFLISHTNYTTAFALECAARSIATMALLLTAIVELGQRLKNRQATSMLVMSGALTLGGISIIGTAFAINSQNTGEWECRLNGNLCATRSINVVPPVRGIKGKADWAAVLVDGEPNLDQALIHFNGKEMRARCRSIYEIPNAYRYQQTLIHTMQTEADAEGIGKEKLRQWRLFKVPVELLRQGFNHITISAKPNCSVTIYGDYNSRVNNRLTLPSTESFAVCKVQAGGSTRDGRPTDTIGYPLAEARNRLASDDVSIFKTGQPEETQGNLQRTTDVVGGDGDLSPSSGTQQGDYRIFLMVAHRKQYGPDYDLDGMTFSNRLITVY